LKKAQYENIELGEGSLTSTQIQNIKKLWNDPEKKTAKDVTQAVKDIVNKWDADTRHAVSQAGIKHLSKLAAATESTNRYFDVKPGSIEDAINKMNKLEEMSVTINKKEIDDLVKQYISKGGTVTKLPPVLAPVAPGEKPPKEWDLVKGKSVPGSNQGQIAYKVKKVGSGYKILKAQLREFIRIYNEHFLTNYAAEEFIIEDRLDEVELEEMAQGSVILQKMKDWMKKNPHKDLINWINTGPSSGAFSHYNKSLIYKLWDGGVNVKRYDRTKFYVAKKDEKKANKIFNNPNLDIRPGPTVIGV
jgi:hypothetical protein